MSTPRVHPSIIAPRGKALSAGRGCRGRKDLVFGGERNIERDHGANAELAFDVHRAAGFTYETVDEAEAQAETITLFFGRKERLEGAPLGIGRHAGAIID